MNADELERLHKLKEKGIISEEEFNEAKERILNGKKSVFDDIDLDFNLEKDQTQRGYNTVLHLSLLLGTPVPVIGTIFPILGFIIPFIMWIIKKDEIKSIDRHGRVVANWALTFIIYAVIFNILKLVLIGFPLFWLLGIVNIVFSLVGAYNAWNGKLWRYPGSFSFFGNPNTDQSSNQKIEI